MGQGFQRRTASTIDSGDDATHEILQSDTRGIEADRTVEESATGKAQWLKLESSRFTTSAAFVREVLALLEATNYKLHLIVKPEEVQRLDAELEGQRTLGRVKVKTSE